MLNIKMYPKRRLDSIRERVPWGICYHTTGSGILIKAREQKRKPIDVALDIYRGSQFGANGYQWGGPAYVIDHDGTVWKMADETTRTNHVGANREAYLSGEWLKKIPAVVVERWRKQWPNFRTPQHLFPSQAPNTDYIGVEMIPIGAHYGGPAFRMGIRFTEAQHEAAVELALEIEVRQNFPKGWYGTPRLVGHEDVGLLDRHDSIGGWDPGWLRPSPHFDFGWVRSHVATRSRK